MTEHERELNRAAVRRYRQRHPDRCKAAWKRWYQKNCEAQRQAAREHYKKNRKAIRAASRKSYTQNRDAIRAKKSSPEYRAKAVKWERQYRSENMEAVRASVRKWQQSNPEKRDAACKQWLSTPRGCAKALLSAAALRAVRYGREFTLTLEDIQPIIEAGRCQATGLPLNMQRKGRCGPHIYSPSLDRIDNSKGYTPDNVRVVCWMYNRCKGSGTDADVLAFARALVEATPYPARTPASQRRFRR